ncbi:hypothetical protein N7540_003172 [Penicillium herquei]|nr:hypothetical protein N7540_003172 [Penicillium herquei]
MSKTRLSSLGPSGTEFESLPDAPRDYHLPNGRMWAPHFPIYNRSGNGFPNDGTLDYRNVIFQMLMHCPPFINWLESYMMDHIGVQDQNQLLREDGVGFLPIEDLICGLRGQECYLCSIWTIYATYWTEASPDNPKFLDEETLEEFSDEVREDHYRSRFNNIWDRIFEEWSKTGNREGQQDPAELWPFLVKILRAQIDPQHLKAINQFDRIFGLPMLAKGVCKGSKACSEPHYSEHQESMMRVHFPLHSKKKGGIRDKFSLQEAINRFFTRETEVTDKCETCKKHGKQTEVIAFPPEVLFVQVNRMSLNDDEPKKNLQPIELVEKLEFNVEQFDPRLNLTPDSARCHYELFWVATHRGSSYQEGHYDCCVKGRKQWSMIDDDQSWPVEGFEDFARTKDTEEQAYIFGYRRYIPGHQQSHPTTVFTTSGREEDPMDVDVPENLTKEEQEDRELLDLSHWNSQDFQRAKRLMITFTDVDGSFSRSVDIVGFAIDPLKRRAMNMIGIPSETTGTLELTVFDRDNHIIESCSMNGYLKDEGTMWRRRDHTKVKIMANQKRRLNTPDDKPNVKKPANNIPPGMTTLGDPSQTRPFDIKDIILAHRPKVTPEVQQREQAEKEKQEKEKQEKEDKEKKEKEKKDKEKAKEEEAKTENGSRRSSLKQSADKLKDKMKEVLKPKDSGVKKNGKEKKDKKDKKSKKKHKTKSKKSKDGDSSHESDKSEAE